MIHVLHFVSTPARWSGVMNVIMNYYRHIDRTKIQFDFLCFLRADDSYEKEIHSLGGNVYYIKKPGNSLKALSEMETFFRDHAVKYQWFHNHEVYLSFYLIKVANKYGINNVIVHSHTTKYSDKWFNSKRNQILCFPIRFMNCKRMACSKAAGDFLYRTECGKKEYMVLHNAIESENYKFDLNMRNELRRKLQIEKSFVIGHVGRFENQKNHKFLIDAFKCFHDQNLDSVLLLIGTGSLHEKMKGYVKEIGIEEQVRFLGQITDVWNYYQAMDQFWLPSLYEGLPMSAVEAQASGLPCLFSDTITKETGILDCVKFLSLDQNVEPWAREAMIMKTNQERIQGKSAVVKAGFDVSNEVLRLERFYLG